MPSGKAIGQGLVGHARWVNDVTISSDDRFLISGSDDFTARVWDVRIGQTISRSLKHDWPVISVCVSCDNQQIISLDLNGKFYLWNVSSGELLKSTTTDFWERVHMLGMAHNGWNSGGEVGVGSNKERIRIASVCPDVYICDPTRNGILPEKVGQSDVKGEEWVVDAKGNVWSRLEDGKVARLEVVTEGFITLQNRENEIIR